MKLPRYDVYAITQFTPKEWVLVSDAEALEAHNKELEEENARLRRACSVLYHGVDEDLQRLAENEYSGCASTQRDNVHELRKVLVGK